MSRKLSCCKVDKDFAFWRILFHEYFANKAITFLVLQFVGNKAKGRISKRVFEENKARQIFPKTNISYPLIRTCAYQGVRNVRFSENLACFVFLKRPFWDSPFCLITDEFTLFVRHLPFTLNKIMETSQLICTENWYGICICVKGVSHWPLCLSYVFNSLEKRCDYGNLLFRKLLKYWNSEASAEAYSETSKTS